MKEITRTLSLLLLLTGAAFAQERICNAPDCPEEITKQERDAKASSNSIQESESYPAEDDSKNANLVPRNSEDIDREARPQNKADQRTRSSRCVGEECNRPPREPLTEFQKFVFSDAGEKLPIFGRNLFTSVPSTFAPADHVPVPAAYVLGPGDELHIRGWGQIDVNARVTVDRDGQIYLPKVGAISVAGVRNDQITQYLKSAIGRVFRNFDLNVSLGRLRSIQVFVVGQAQRPGSYTVSSLSTLVNALFASGGPSVTGSMRHIQLKRQEDVITEFDVYDLLQKGDKSKDVQLLPGDVIYIPPVGRQAAILGSVNVPGIYEVGERTTIGDQIAMAGGLSTTADGTRVLLERIEQRKTRIVADFELDEHGMNQLVMNGDILRLFPISARVNNSVVLRGHVAMPGRYPWHESLRVSDVIPTKESIVTREYWMRQNALARPEHGWSEFSWPSRDKKDEKDPEDRNLQEIPVSLPRNESDINWDYAVVQRLNREDLSTQLVPFNLGKAITDPGGKDNLLLQPGDVITIFSQSDVQVPVNKRSKFVRIEGEVKAAGVYRAEPGETLRHLVDRAGGLTDNAFLYATDFRRVSTQQDQQKRLEQAVDEMQKQLQARGKSLLNSAAGNPQEITVAREQIQAEQQIVDRLRRTKATGRIVLGLKPDDASVEALPEVEVEDGDTITIPSRPSTVSIVGAVYNQSSFLFGVDMPLKQYLQRAGGPTREADTDRTFVIRADGSVISSQMHRSIWSGGFESLKVLPGDTAVVPERIKTGSVLKSLRDWSQVFAQFALGAAAIQVLRQ